MNALPNTKILSTIGKNSKKQIMNRRKRWIMMKKREKFEGLNFIVYLYTNK